MYSPGRKSHSLLVNLTWTSVRPHARYAKSTQAAPNILNLATESLHSDISLACASLKSSDLRLKSPVVSMHSLRGRGSAVRMGFPLRNAPPSDAQNSSPRAGKRITAAFGAPSSTKTP